MSKITDHRYNCGPNKETGGPCLHPVTIRRGAGSDPWFEHTTCGKARDQHELTEYDDLPDAGAMHEPKPYTGELDWPDDCAVWPND